MATSTSGWCVPVLCILISGGVGMGVCGSAFRLMEVLWLADLSVEERLERARLLAKEVAAAAAVAEGRVDDLLKAFPGHFELVVKLGQPSCQAGSVSECKTVPG